MIWTIRTMLAASLEWLADVLVDRSARFGAVADLLDDGDLEGAETLMTSLRHEFGGQDRDVMHYSAALERLKAVKT